ncbi:MAG: hypothetical protein AABY07_05085 [Nanoarchaeota archaeon]
MFGKTNKTDKRIIKEERFKKVASRRVQEILNKMRLLKNCANKGNYSYSEEQANKIVSTIDSEWKKVKSEFNNSKPKKEEFSL